MVPTRSAAEWSSGVGSFIGNLNDMQGISLAACVINVEMSQLYRIGHNRPLSADCGFLMPLAMSPTPPPCLKNGVPHTAGVPVNQLGTFLADGVEFPAGEQMCNIMATSMPGSLGCAGIHVFQAPP